MSQEIKKVGIVATGNISKGGGYPRVVYDLIETLNQLGKEVYLLTPFKVDTDKIEQLYGKIEIKKIYNPGKIKEKFCVEDVFRRKLMKKEFVEMAKEVDFIFDICGRIMDKYIPKDFDRNKYVVWALSPPPEEEKWESVKNLKRNIKERIRMMLNSAKFLPSKEIKIFTVDKWTKDSWNDKYNLNLSELILYPPIQTGELLWKGEKKEKQIIVSGRIDPIKRIEDSIKIFAKGTEKFPEYKLVIIGGMSPESAEYIKLLKKISEELGILGKISIISDPSFEQIKKELLKSQILIDSQREVNVTMTSIEGLASGNIIISNKNSSCYKEILDEGKYGYGFSEVSEGAKILEKVLEELSKEQPKEKIHVQRAELFSMENFVRNVANIIKEDK